MKKRGEITVFFSLIFVCILSLILGLLESARTTGARLYGQMAADSAASSVMSHYNRNLWDLYGILFLETESTDALEPLFSEHLEYYLDQKNWYPMELEQVQITARERMTEDGGIWLEQEALSYVKSRFVDVAEQWLDHASTAEQLGIYEDRRTWLRQTWTNMEDALEEMKTEKEEDRDDGGGLGEDGIKEDNPENGNDNDRDVDDEEDEEEQVEVDWDAVNTVQRLTSLLQGSLAAKLLPEGVEISKRNVSLTGIPSKNKTRIREETKSDENLGQYLIDQIGVNEYCRMKFDSFLSRCQRAVPLDRQPLLYEQEYLLCGESSDRANLLETAEKLLALRSAFNLLSLSGSSAMRAEADLLALTISGGYVPLQSVLSVLLLSLWALGEAFVDVKHLLRGDPVPFWKEEGQWNLDLDGLLSFAFLDDLPGSRTDGEDYQDHLRILFLMMDRAERNFRMMDVIQWNLRTIQEDFSVRDCIHRIEVNGKLMEQHVFSIKGRYTRTVKTVGYYEIGR